MSWSPLTVSVCFPLQQLFCFILLLCDCMEFRLTLQGLLEALRHLLSFASSNFLAQQHMVKSSSKSIHCGQSGCVIITHACFMPWNRIHSTDRTPHHVLSPITLQTPHQIVSSKRVKSCALLRLDWCSMGQ